MGKDQPDIRERSFGYSLRAIKLYQALQQRKDGAGWVLGKQYLRAATSVGAIVEDAQSAESRPDFVHKYGIAQKEARESLYWLKLLAESGIISLPRLKPLMKQTEELFAVITGIILSAKRRGLKGKG
ncbi:MAG: four helix bundle protein [Terriglobia bacterium]